MKFFFAVLAMLVGLALAPGCAKDEQKAAPAAAGEEAAPGAKQATEEGTVAKVEVPKEGKKFDPPIKPEQVPDGAWYCDMGTVHYARGEKGDGVCPICKMKLTQATWAK